MGVDREESRLWAEHHQAYSRWVGTVVRDVAHAFRVLARIRFDQPWREGNARDGCH